MQRTRLIAAGGIVVAAAAIVHSGIFGPGPNTETIPSTGQPMTLTITAPTTGTNVPMPPGTVNVSADVTIGAVSGQSVNILYIMDVSGSTDLNFQTQEGVPYVDADGDGVGSYATPDPDDNLNGLSGDTEAGEVLDGEIAGVLALHASVGTPSFPVRVGLEAFASTAVAADVGPGGGLQVFATPPQVDLGGSAGPDVVEVARSFRSELGGNGMIALFSSYSVGSGTDYVAALTTMNNTLALFPAATFNQAFFLSDGVPTESGLCTAGACDVELAEAVAAGTVVHTVGVGAGAAPAELQYISNATNGMFVQVTDPSDLSNVLPDIPPAGIAGCTLNGMSVAVSPLGTISETFTCTAAGPATLTITCTADDPESTTVSADVDIECVEILCGDGEPDPGEECDPPNTPTCDANCQRIPTCGDGFVDAPELCDDGNLLNGDCCSQTCQVEPVGQPCPDDGNACTINACDGVQGVCVATVRPNGTICSDGDSCTINDSCQAGQCTGGSTSDTDGDGDCDLREIDCGCDFNDAAEVCLLPNRQIGLPSGSAGEVLMNWYEPTELRFLVATAPGCDNVGQCVASRCTRGRVYDVCSTDADCAQPPETCRTIVNWAFTPDIALDFAKIRRNPVPGYTPPTPGCSRKVDVALDPTRPITVLKLKARGTIDGRLRKERDVFKFVR